MGPCCPRAYRPDPSLPNEVETLVAQEPEKDLERDSPIPHEPRVLGSMSLSGLELRPEEGPAEHPVRNRVGDNGPELVSPPAEDGHLEKWGEDSVEVEVHGPPPLLARHEKKASVTARLKATWSGCPVPPVGW